MGILESSEAELPANMWSLQETAFNTKEAV